MSFGFTVHFAHRDSIQITANSQVFECSSVRQTTIVDNIVQHSIEFDSIKSYYRVQENAVYLLEHTCRAFQILFSPSNGSDNRFPKRLMASKCEWPTLNFGIWRCFVFSGKIVCFIFLKRIKLVWFGRSVLFVSFSNCIQNVPAFWLKNIKPQMNSGSKATTSSEFRVESVNTCCAVLCYDVLCVGFFLLVNVRELCTSMYVCVEPRATSFLAIKSIHILKCILKLYSTQQVFFLSFSCVYCCCFCFSIQHRWSAVFSCSFCYFCYFVLMRTELLLLVFFRVFTLWKLKQQNHHFRDHTVPRRVRARSFKPHKQLVFFF